MLLFVLALFSWQQPAAEPPKPAAASPALDFDYFKARVQPVFLYKREGHARCYVCHRGDGTGTSYLSVLSPGATTWDDAQSRQNFQWVRRYVVPGRPERSRLLMHPLSVEAGGDEFHAGGKHWDSQADPEWQMLAAWVRGATLNSGTR
jgi:hypothetical protein